MTGAEDECPYHPHHSPVLELLRGLTARRHRYARLPRTITKPITIAVTTPIHARIIGSISRLLEVTAFEVSAALYSNAVAITALVRNPAHGSEPVLK